MGPRGELSCGVAVLAGGHGLSGETEPDFEDGVGTFRKSLCCGRGRAHGTPELRCRAQPGPRARTWLRRGLTALQPAELGVRAVDLCMASRKINIKISGIRARSTLETTITTRAIDYYVLRSLRTRLVTRM